MKAPASIAERPANEECDNGNISEKMLPLPLDKHQQPQMFKQDMRTISSNLSHSPNSIVGNSMRENFYHAPV